MKCFRRICAFGLVFLLVLCIQSGEVVNAASKKVVMLPGEEKTVSPGIGKLKSVQSSNSTIVTVKKSGKKCVFTAGKDGTATVTVKSKKKTKKYSVTVKKLVFDTEVVSIAHSTGYYGITSKVAVKVTNSTGIYVDNGFLNCKLIDDTGAAVSEEKVNISFFINGSSVYRVFEYTGKTSVVSAEIVFGDFLRNDKNKVVDQSSLITSELISSSDIGRAYKLTNNAAQIALGDADLLCYDSDGNIIKVCPLSFYLRSGETQEFKVPGLSANMKDFKIVVRGISNA